MPFTYSSRSQTHAWVHTQYACSLTFPFWVLWLWLWQWQSLSFKHTNSISSLVTVTVTMTVTVALIHVYFGVYLKELFATEDDLFKANSRSWHCDTGMILRVHRLSTHTHWMCMLVDFPISSTVALNVIVQANHSCIQYYLQKKMIYSAATTRKSRHCDWYWSNSKSTQTHFTKYCTFQVLIHFFAVAEYWQKTLFWPVILSFHPRLRLWTWLEWQSARYSICVISLQMRKYTNTNTWQPYIHIYSILQLPAPHPPDARLSPWPWLWPLGHQNPATTAHLKTPLTQTQRAPQAALILQ